MKLSTDMWRFLQELLKSFEKSGFGPLILRNYEKLPEEIGNDLDIFVLPQYIISAESQLMEMTRKYGAEVLHRHGRSYFTAFWIKFVDSNEILHIDLYPGALEWHGFTFLESNELLTGSRRLGELPVPRPAHEALLLFLTSLLWGGYIKQSYQTKICKYLSNQEEHAEFKLKLGEVFGAQALDIASRLLSGETGQKVSLKQLRALRFRLVRYSLLRDPICAFRGWFRHWHGEIVNYLRPPGLVVHLAIFDQKQFLELSTKISAKVSFYFGNVHILNQPLGPLDTIQTVCHEYYLSGRNYLVFRQSSTWSVAGKTFANTSTENPELKITEQILSLLAQGRGPVRSR